MGKLTSPCCCNLQIGTFLVAIFNIVCSLIGLIYYIVVLFIGASLAFIEFTKDSSDQFTNGDIRDSNSRGSLILFGIVALVVTVFIILGFLANLLIGILLLLGARARNEAKCRIWFFVTAIFLVAYVIYKISIVGMIIWAQPEEGVARFTAEIISLIICVLIECYQLWVVHVFIQEVRRYSRRDQIRPEIVYTPAPKKDDR